MPENEEHKPVARHSLQHRLDLERGYTCRVRFGTDEHVCPFSVRTLTWGKDGICLNGERMIMGLLVMDEYIDHWYILKNEHNNVQYFSDWWQQDLTDMARFQGEEFMKRSTPVLGWKRKSAPTSLSVR